MHDERENFFVSQGVLVADDKKFFIVVNEGRDEFSKYAEGRISDYDVSFPKEVETFFGAEIARAIFFVA